jgi:hypothetical protein
MSRLTPLLQRACPSICRLRDLRTFVSRANSPNTKHLPGFRAPEHDIINSEGGFANDAGTVPFENPINHFPPFGV